MSFFLSSLRPVFFNCGLIAIGSIIFVLGMNSILIPQKLLSGGLIGVALIAHYLIPALDVGLLYFLLNIPLILLGWFYVGRRFMLYSIFGMTFLSAAAAILKSRPAGVEDPILAALFAGVVCGAGGGIILRSLGSGGGLDILAIYVTKRFGIRPGAVLMAANLLIILTGIEFFDLEIALYSIIFVYTNSKVIDMVITGFNSRKSLLIVSNHSTEIAGQILTHFNRGVTFLKGEGGYTGEKKDIIFTVTTLTELARMKDMVFKIDPNSFMVVNDTLEVFGKRHGSQRVY